MYLYLPIAELSVNALYILMLGVAVGLLSGMFGLGGGFLTTPFLVFFGIPPAVAAASAATQQTGASVSGLLAHRRGGVDFKMGWLLVSGGTLGSLFGAFLFALLQRSGQIDTVINVLYVVLLLAMGGAMTRSALLALRAQRAGGDAPPATRRRQLRFVAALPWRTRFPASGIVLSPLAPILLGFVTGIATALLGVGGGFLLIPAKVYLFGMRTKVVAGTSLFQIVFVTATATVTNALTNHSVDVVLAGLLLVGSAVSAQVGTRIAQRADPTLVRLAFGLIVLLVGVRLFWSLTVRPEELYTVQAA